LQIVLISASYPPNPTSGAERVAQMLAEGLAARDHRVTVITTQPKGIARLSELNRVAVHYLPVRNVYRPFDGNRPGILRRGVWHAVDSYNLLMAMAVRKLLLDLKPDVVNSHNVAGLSAGTLPVMRNLDIAHVHTLHDQYLLCPNSMMFRDDKNCKVQCVACRAYALPRRHVARQIKSVVGVSQYILDRHDNFGYFKDADKRVICNAVAMPPEPESRSQRPDRLIRFGFIGQIRRSKGVHALLNAFMAECPNEAELWIAGLGDEGYEAELRSASAGSTSIVWCGYVNARDFLTKVDVLVVPSTWHDTAPLVLLESFAAGRPVIGANRGGIPEFIRPDRGWIVDPDSQKDFQAVLRSVLSCKDTIDEMGRHARVYASTLSLNRFLDEYECAFEDEMKKKSTRLIEQGGLSDA